MHDEKFLLKATKCGTDPICAIPLKRVEQLSGGIGSLPGDQPTGRHEQHKHADTVHREVHIRAALGGLFLSTPFIHAGPVGVARTGRKDPKPHRLIAIEDAYGCALECLAHRRLFVRRIVVTNCGGSCDDTYIDDPSGPVLLAGLLRICRDPRNVRFVAAARLRPCWLSASGFLDVFHPRHQPALI